MYQHTLQDRVNTIKQVAASQSNVSNKWLAYLTDKEAVIRLIKGNQQLIDILLDILTKEYEAELRSPRAEYGTKGWALLQADKNGYKRAIENFTNLLTIKD